MYNCGTILAICCLMALTRGQPECICFEDVAADLKSPTVVHEPLDGTGRLLTVTWEGVIYVYYKNGTNEDRPFLNITDRVTSGGEKGLVGFVTHPNVTENKRFYVVYTDGDFVRLSQFHVTDTDPNIADPDSEVIMIELKKESRIHHAGQVQYPCLSVYLPVCLFVFVVIEKVMNRSSDHNKVINLERVWQK